MSDRLDCVVIGAGVVGLAVARALAIGGRDVTVVEAADAIGSGVSARNSEVIHAGLHYPPGSLKALLCLRGKARLYDYCDRRHVPFRRIGKLIVATDDAQRAALDALADNARLCGVDDVEALDATQAARLEPEVRCVAALWSPSTGIVDSHALMLALLADAEAAGAVLALSSRVVGGAITAEGIALDVAAGDARSSVTASLVVNCASLNASRVARSIHGMPARHVPETRPVKGHYFALAGRTPFRHLVYPVPASGGLGIHLTLDLAGRARFGPDVEWLPSQSSPASSTPSPPEPSLDYAVDARRSTAFAAAIRRYWPGLPEDALAPDYAGIRPRITGPGEPLADFVIAGPAEHGVPGLIHLFGIESPGLTASLALGEHVAASAACGARSASIAAAQVAA